MLESVVRYAFRENAPRAIKHNKENVWKTNAVPRVAV